MLQLFYRYFQGKATQEEEQRIMDYAESSEAAKKEFLSERKLYDAFLLNTDMNETQLERLSERKVFRIFRPLLRVSAVVALLLSIAYFTHQYYFVPGKTLNRLCVYVPAGGLSELQLPDGSVVHLNSRSTLWYPASFDKHKREVAISGEGYFEVVKGKIPFVVKSNRYEVTVLGTVFNINDYRYDGHSCISLIEGSVKVCLEDDKQPEEILRPNEHLIFDGQNYKRGEIDNHDIFLWRNGLLVFDDMPFHEMAGMLEKYFDVRFIIANTDLAVYRCTGKFLKREGIEHILKVLQKTADFKYRYNDNVKNEIIIY
jgi:ferric-dicitrate binding protein FerR (iron transport regulator)